MTLIRVVAAEVFEAQEPKALAQPEAKLPRRAVKLPDGLWFKVMSYLRANDLLARVARLSAEMAAKVADPCAWSTLALPEGTQQARRFLELAMAEEKLLWAPILRRVQKIDLDLDGCGWYAIKHFQELLLHGVDLEGQLAFLRVRNLRAIPPWEDQFSSLGGDDQGPSWFDDEMVRLVNPVVPTAPAAPRLFLLQPGELGRLRFLMRKYRHFRLTVSTIVLPLQSRFLEVAPPAKVDFEAQLEAQEPSQGPGREDGDRGCASCDTARAQLDLELGQLRELRTSHGTTWNEADFDRWLDFVLPWYRMLIESWA